MQCGCRVAVLAMCTSKLQETLSRASADTMLQQDLSVYVLHAPHLPTECLGSLRLVAYPPSAGAGRRSTQPELTSSK
jgi:hypothetical protein